jgi:hypothetical protein
MKRPSKTKRIAKTKRRTPARKPAAAPTQITISERMLAAAAILVSDKDCGPDSCLGRVCECCKT